MISGDNGEMGELEEGSAEDKLAAPAEAHEPIPKWYRGDLNGAYQKWREGGKPEDPDHPLTQELLSEACLFANRSTQKARRSSQALNNDDESENRISAANEESIRRAMMLYDPDREGAGSFTTYVKKAILNNIRDELRRVNNPTHQAELLRAHNGNRDHARWWINQERHEWERIKNDLELVAYYNIAPKDRPLAHWLLDQDPNTKITWRQVLSAFPVYKTDDTAGRALKRVKKAIEKARFYRF